MWRRVCVEHAQFTRGVGPGDELGAGASIECGLPVAELFDEAQAVPARAKRDRISPVSISRVREFWVVVMAAPSIGAATSHVNTRTRSNGVPNRNLRWQRLQQQTGRMAPFSTEMRTCSSL